MMLHRCVFIVSTLALFVAASETVAQETTSEAARAMVGSSQSTGYSAWDVQFLYGTEFQEPFNPDDVHKTIMTVENSSAWSWGSSYAFLDTVYSTKNDTHYNGNPNHAWEFYGEWYPSASLSYMTGKSLAAGVINDVSLTAGINAGHKSTGANPLIYLPGLTFDLKLPGVTFFSLGVYAYIDQGQINDNENNGCHSTGMQLTPSWLVPFSLGEVDFQFGGFLDYITEHGDCKEQVVSQPQLTVDLGKLLGLDSGKLYAGTEYQYWNNKFGIQGLDESFPQALVIYRF
jgi:nucleoside-specific outer membrane channel protein Tsx